MAKKSTAKKKASPKKTPAKKAAPKRSAAKGRAATSPKRAAASRPRAKRGAARKAGTQPRAPAKKRGAASKKAAVRAAARAPAKAPATKKKASPRAGQPRLRRRDGAGHIDPKYAHDLLEKSGHSDPEGRSFLDRPRSKDDLVEELGEEFVEEATSAEHEGEDVQDQPVPEDQGGPFVETTAKEEFAYGTDPSNPKGAKREPFPTT